ncbi:DPH4-like [Mizuhopecten yessoensis]|uniref:DPH4-like n=1 Tax=Mizuhopecten yessoensis TaxID=6573 RepID=A0A210Q3K7_MIZYE|nr:DPH4-like [Mizuhopecten yessoensis]
MVLHTITFRNNAVFEGLKVARYPKNITLKVLKIMEDLYNILECQKCAKQEDLKKSYQRLALRFHPDKQSEEEKETSTAMFVRVNHAWKILSDNNLRQKYDAAWTQRCLAQDWPIQDEVEIGDFVQGESEGSEEESTFFYMCRCGGNHILFESDITLRLDIVCCDTCSLTIRVLYTDTDV